MINFKLYLFLLHLLCVLCFGSAIRPGYTYHDKLNGWLKLHLQPVTWRDARISCHMEGAFLASAWTTEFSLALYQLQSDGQQSSEHAVPALYSGFHTTSAEGAFTFVNGKPAITLDHDGLAALERCGAFFVNGTTGEVGCDSLLPYVCYVPAPATTPAPQTVSATCPAPVPVTCPTSASATSSHLLDTGYELSNTTGHWYKFHTEGKYWNDANRTCAEEGTHLAIINSKIEAEALEALYEKHKEKIDADERIWIIIGNHKDSLGVWRTVDGQTLTQAGYEKWFPDHPIASKSEGLMTWDGRLLSFDNNILAFICEQELIY